jgi:hypothetical protein
LMRTAFLDGLMRTAFSAEWNEDGFFRWIKWGRLFELGWMRTAFSDGFNEDGFFR